MIATKLIIFKRAALLHITCWCFLSVFASTTNATILTEPLFSFYLPNIGQGNCVILSKTDKSFVGIFDCGSISNRESKWKDKLKPLIEQLISKKRSKWLIVISHPDHDHYNFLPAIIDHIKPNLRERNIQLTLVLGGMLEKYFYYQGHYSLINTIQNLTSMRKSRIKIVSMSHDIGISMLQKIIKKTSKIKEELKIPKPETDELVTELIGDADYTKNAAQRRIDKELTAITKKLSKMEITKANKNAKNSIQKDLELSLKDRSNLLPKSIKQYFRDNYLSHPLQNRLHGYQENKNLEEFIGLKIIPADLTVTVLSANGGQSCTSSNPATVINDDENVNSLVLQIVHKKTGYSILLPGDATGATTDRVLSHISSNMLGRVQYALASHHGADTDETNNREWIDLIRPNFVLFSASTQGNNFNHPRSSVVAHYLTHAMPGIPHNLTCFTRRNERGLESAFKPFEIKKEFFDKDDDKITIKNVNKQVYYCGDANYFEGPLPFPNL